MTRAIIHIHDKISDGHTRDGLPPLWVEAWDTSDRLDRPQATPGTPRPEQKKGNEKGTFPLKLRMQAPMWTISSRG